MRPAFPPEVEAGRIRSGKFETGPGDPEGMFFLRCPPSGRWITVMAGPGSRWAAEGMPGPAWDHVSVSAQLRCPSWEEMCWVKDAFFLPEECVVQYHPPKASYVNDHPHCLHLWRVVDAPFPMPPIECL